MGAAIVGLGLFVILGSDRFLFAQRTPVVYVAPIEGPIDLGLAPFVERALSEATDASAAAVIFEINTFGGRVDVAPDGELIESGAPIGVTRVGGNRIVVRRYRSTERS